MVLAVVWKEKTALLMAPSFGMLEVFSFAASSFGAHRQWTCSTVRFDSSDCHFVAATNDNKALDLF